MALLSTYEEARLTKPPNQFWSSFNHFLEPARELNFEFDQESQPSIWQSLIDSQDENLFHGLQEDCDAFSDIGKFEAAERPRNDWDKKQDKTLESVVGKLDSLCVVDGGAIGDVPAVYSIRGLRPNELPVKGTFVHPSIIPGFCYVVRPVDSSKPLFEGKALCLQRIGMGYGKRLTFADELRCQSENYFWSDTNPEGYGFSLHLVNKKDVFTLEDANKVPIGRAEVIEVLGKQIEVKHEVRSRKVEKEATVSLKCDIQYFEENFPSHETLTISGTALAVKDSKSKKPASVYKIKNCRLDGKKGFSLVSPSKHSNRSIVIKGNSVNDVPTTYNVTGLLEHEIPVVGTIVDSRIVPGFKYKVRTLDSKTFLFGGASLPLQSIGKGYAKRLTFAGKSINENDNYFWSDSNSAGYGFTIEVVSEGDTFVIEDSHGITIGRASVYRTEYPQREINSFVANKVYTKMVRVTITCHLSIYGEPDLTTAVTGVAVVERRRGIVRVNRIDHIAIGAQLNNLLTSDEKYVRFILE